MGLSFSGKGPLSQMLSQALVLPLLSLPLLDLLLLLLPLPLPKIYVLPQKHQGRSQISTGVSVSCSDLLC